MHLLLVIVMVVALVATGPLEARLWRAGKLSDAAMAALMLVRMPAVALGYSLIVGAEWPRSLGATLGALLVAVLLFRSVRAHLRTRSPSSSVPD